MNMANILLKLQGLGYGFCLSDSRGLKPYHLDIYQYDGKGERIHDNFTGETIDSVMNQAVTKFGLEGED